MNLTGAVTKSTTTDASGNYTFTGLANGSYTVTPSKTGWTLYPTSRAVTVDGANVTDQNFSAWAFYASLNGDYLFMVTEVHNPGALTYYEQFGTVSFDGAGSVTVNGTSRCSDGTTVTTSPLSMTIDYSVNTDGSFTINASGPKPLHGQIALDGTSLLLDGTMQGTSANDYLNHGVAMKR